MIWEKWQRSRLLKQAFEAHKLKLTYDHIRRLAQCTLPSILSEVELSEDEKADLQELLSAASSALRQIDTKRDALGFSPTSLDNRDTATR